MAKDIERNQDMDHLHYLVIELGKGLAVAFRSNRIDNRQLTEDRICEAQEQHARVIRHLDSFIPGGCPDE